MTDAPIEQPTHPDELLPWFVNGTLSDVERQVVELHLERCPQCHQETVLLEKMRTEVKNLPIQSPGELGLNRLLHQVRASQHISNTEALPQTGWWRTGLAIAASLIISVQAGLLIDAWYLSRPMVPLAGPQRQEPVIQVSFVSTATATEIRQIISIVHGNIIEGPSPLGIYRIHLDLESSNTQDVEQIIHLLRQESNIIQHVAQD